MKMLLFFFGITIIFVTVNGYDSDYQQQGCRLNVLRDVPQPDPLLIIPGTTNFFEPDAKGIIEIRSGESIELYCDSKFKEFLTDNKVTAECFKGKIFKVKENKVQFLDLECKNWQMTTLRRTKKPCYHGATSFEVGFNLDGKKFAKLYEICYNETIESTLYVHHKLNPFSNVNHKQRVDRTQFEDMGVFSSPKTDSLYTQYVQQKNIDKLLGGIGTSHKYFDIPNDIFLARGHLNAKTDYIYPSQQRATFLLINVAPQWQSFNNGNWAEIESGVRQLAGKRGLYLDVYTGTWGVATLPDVNGNKKELFLNLIKNGRKIPVPKLYYKIIIDSNSKKGIVLIGVNNIHIPTTDIKDYIICEDVSNKISWLDWNPTDIEQGYSYACEVSNFVKVVKDLPKLNVEGLLY